LIIVQEHVHVCLELLSFILLSAITDAARHESMCFDAVIVSLFLLTMYPAELKRHHMEQMLHRCIASNLRCFLMMWL